jgi:hypothetical protein
MKLMADTPTSRAADVAKLAPGTLVEVKGTLRCAALLTAEFSQQPCVYFNARIIQEEEYYEADSDGKQTRRTRSNTIHSNVQQARCTVEDDSGSVALDLAGATVEGVETVDREPDREGMTGALVGLAEVIGANTYTKRLRETILPADIAIYLLGEVRADGTIGAPAKGSHNKTFLVSNQSEEQRAKSLSGTAGIMYWITGILMVIAAGLLFLAWRHGPR